MWIGDSQVSHMQCRTRVRASWRREITDWELRSSPTWAKYKVHKTPNTKLWFTKETLWMKAFLTSCLWPSIFWSVKWARHCTRGLLASGVASKRYCFLIWSERQILGTFYASPWMPRQHGKAWTKMKGPYYKQYEYTGKRPRKVDYFAVTNNLYVHAFIFYPLLKGKNQQGDKRTVAASSSP